jgi:hypothetical protein
MEHPLVDIVDDDDEGFEEGTKVNLSSFPPVNAPPSSIKLVVATLFVVGAAVCAFAASRSGPSPHNGHSNNSPAPTPQNGQRAVIKMYPALAYPPWT